MILMPQIFDVTANENARYKRNEFRMLYHSHGGCCIVVICQPESIIQY